MEIDFVTPRKKTKSKREFELNNRTISILEYYSRYTQYSEGEVLDIFILNLLKDESFIEWANKQRYNKRILAAIYDIDESEVPDGNNKESNSDETTPIEW